MRGMTRNIASPPPRAQLGLEGQGTAEVLVRLFGMIGQRAGGGEVKVGFGVVGLELHQAPKRIEGGGVVGLADAAGRQLAQGGGRGGVKIDGSEEFRSGRVGVSPVPEGGGGGGGGGGVG